MGIVIHACPGKESMEAIYRLAQILGRFGALFEATVPPFGAMSWQDHDTICAAGDLYEAQHRLAQLVAGVGLETICAKCGVVFMADLGEVRAWGNSGRPYDPTDWECWVCQRGIPMPWDPKPVYECEVCGYTADSPQALGGHKRWCRACGYCGRRLPCGCPWEDEEPAVHSRIAERIITVQAHEALEKVRAGLVDNIKQAWPIRKRAAYQGERVELVRRNGRGSGRYEVWEAEFDWSRPKLQMALADPDLVCIKLPRVNLVIQGQIPPDLMEVERHAL